MWSQLGPNSDTGSRLIYSSEIDDPGNNYNPTTAIYTVSQAGNYAFEANMRFDSPSNLGGNGLPTMELSLNKNGSTQLASSLFYFGTQFSTPATSSLEVSTPGVIPLQVGDTITVDWFIDNANNSQIPAGAIYAINPKLNYFSDSAPARFENVPVTMSAQFDSKTLSKDLFLGFVNQFNLITTPNPNNPRNIFIEPFDTWIELGRILDWTDKVDQAKRMSIKHPISEQSRTIINKNSDDADRFSVLSQDNDPNFQYGTRRTISNSTVTKGETIIESLYGPTVLGSAIASGSVDVEGNSTFNLSNNTFILPHLYKFDNKTQKSYIFKPRLGYKVTNLNIPNAAGGNIKIGAPEGFVTSSTYATLSNLNELPASADSLNLHFDNQYVDLIPSTANQDTAETAYNTYWKSYIDSLYWTEARKIVVDIKFSPEEYKDIRLNDRIIIKNQTYRINKISGFNLQKPDIAKVELLKFYPNRKPGPLLTPSNTPAPSITPTPSRTPVSATPTATPSSTPASATPTPTPTPTPSISSIPGPGVAFTRTQTNSTANQACGVLTSVDVFFDSSNPQNGDTAYKNVGLTSPDNGDGGFYGVGGVTGTPDFSVNINTFGIISNKSACIT